LALEHTVNVLDGESVLMTSAIANQQIEIVRRKDPTDWFKAVAKLYHGEAWKHLPRDDGKPYKGWNDFVSGELGNSPLVPRE
jgi:hypothetical protein